MKKSNSYGPRNRDDENEERQNSAGGVLATQLVTNININPQVKDPRAAQPKNVRTTLRNIKITKKNQTAEPSIEESMEKSLEKKLKKEGEQKGTRTRR